MADIDPLDAAEIAIQTMFEDAGSFNDAEESAPDSGTPALSIDDQGRAHGPDGKFASVAERTPAPVEEEVEEATAEEVVDGEEKAGQPEEGQEPEPETAVVEESQSIEEDLLELDLDHPFFAKYGGDPEKAFEALAHQESLIGRQGQELGEKRRIEEELAALRQAVELQRASASIDWDDQIAESPEKAANLALEYQDGPRLAQALNAWLEEEPGEATMYMMALQSLLSQQESQPAALQGDVPHQVSRDELKTEMDEVLARHPDAQDEKVVRAIAEIAKERPVLSQALRTGDARSRALAFEDLYFLAKSRTVASDTSQAARKIALKARADNEQAKADAAVVSANRTSAAKAPSDTEVLQTALRELGGLDDDFVIVG